MDGEVYISLSEPHQIDPFVWCDLSIQTDLGLILCDRLRVVTMLGSRQSMRSLLRAFKLPLGQNVLLRCQCQHCQVQPELQLAPCPQLTPMNCLV